MDTAFFRKAKKVNRAVEITDLEAVIPAVSGSSEIRVALPNRRPLTIEERQKAIEVRTAEITSLEEVIESERKALLQLVKTFQSVKTGGPEVVAQNLKIKMLMEKRAALAHPEKWIEELSGITFKDIFESKRDTRKLGTGVAVYQVKRRVEPISSLYIDLGAAAEKAALEAEEQEATSIATATREAATSVATSLAKAIAATALPKPDAAKAATGAIIAQRKTIKLKKPGAPST